MDGWGSNKLKESSLNIFGGAAPNFGNFSGEAALNNERSSTKLGSINGAATISSVG